MTTRNLTRWFTGITRLTSSEPAAEASPDRSAQVHAAVDALPLVLFEIDANGVYTAVAGGLIKLFGITPELLIGRSVFEFPKFVPGKNVIVRRALAGETVTFTGIWPRGRYLIRFVPRFDADGRVSAVVALGHELAKPTTTDKQLEELLEALRQSEGRFRAMCDCAPLAICVTDPKLVVGYANPALCALLQKPADELLGRPFAALLHSDERARRGHTRDAPAVPELGGVLQFTRSDGASVWTSLRMAAMRDDGELLGYVAVIVDVTQERAARLSVESAQQDLRRVIESSPEGIAVVRDQRWVFVNPALVQALGYTEADALLGREFVEIVHPEERVLALELAERPAALLESGATCELRCRSASGEYVLLELCPALLSEFEGAPALLISARDITEKKRLQARLAVTERLLAVGTLAAGVAHEINNPLAAALSNLEWVATQLAEASAASPRADDALPRHGERTLARLANPIAEAREACERVRGIVQDLKLLSRADEELLGPVDLTRVIDSAVRMAWNELRHRARLVREYGPLPHVYGNEARLAQVLLNLLINATQAIPEGGGERHEVRVAARTGPSGKVIVEVQDSGSGIPADILGRIFDPFFTTKPPGIGTGLGLSICQRIVTGMGGQIEVESRVGQGSTFRVLLAPASHSAPDPHPPAAPAALRAESAPRARVLVIDDDPAVGAALELMLAEEHEVERFTSARRALERIQEGLQYDTILCDLMMPELSGMDFHRELTAAYPALASRVVFLTGGAFTAGARAFLDETPNPRLGKPFNWQELRALIASQLTRLR